jgi:hypothetical protein
MASLMTCFGLAPKGRLIITSVNKDGGYVQG